MNDVRKELTLAFHDTIKGAELSKTLPFEFSELFASQKNADKAKKILKNEFLSATKVYFSRFMKNGGVDADGLLQDLESHEKTMRRHLGNVQFEHLKLVATLLKMTEPKKKGLLAS